MKRLYFLFMLIILGICVNAQDGRVTIVGNKFYVGDKPIWFNGINTPWHNFNDFGRQDFDPAWWEAEFQRYVDNKINLARVWIFGSGEVNPLIDADGTVTGVNSLFYQHMDKLFELSRTKKVYILPALLSFDIVKNSYTTYQRYRNMLASPAKIQSFIDKVIIPLVKRYDGEPYLLGWEICNEPEWMFENAECGPVAFDDVRRLHAMVAAAIHKNCSHYVTTGSAAPKWNAPIYDNWGDREGDAWSAASLQSVYNDPAAYLDFYQYHWYPWQTQWMASPFTQTTVQYGVDFLPVIVGESEGNNVCDQYICQTVSQMYENAYLNGFDGVCAWKTPQNDGHGTFENIAVATNAFYAKYPQLVYPQSSGTTVPVTGVTVSPTTLSLTVGQTATLTATVSPANATNKNVTWSSSNTSVATVSSTGVVTAVAAGSATITVTTVDGSKTANCAVTVTGSTTVPVTGVTVSPTTLSLTVGQTATLTATVSPANATNKSVTWSSSNTSVATVSSTGVVTAVAAGSATVTVTTVDGGYAATCNIIINDNTTIGVQKYEAEDAVLYGISVASYGSGYSGSGYVYGNTFDQEGDRVVFNVNVPSTGQYALGIRFRNVCGVCEKYQYVKINGGVSVNTHFKGTTGDWEDLQFGNISLNAGNNTIEIIKWWGWMDIDYITIGSSSIIPVTGVTVSPTTLSLTVGQTATLTATVSPANATNKSVTWSSSNTSVATVSSTGVVTAVAAGSATITVTTVDGAKTATCAVTVTAGGTTTPCSNPIAITIPFSKDGAGEFCFVSSQQPAYINSWNMDKVEINGVDYTNKWSNTMPAAIDGKWYVYYKGSFPWSHFEAPAAKSSTSAATANIEIYPNPFNDVINIKSNANRLSKIEIYSSMGQLLDVISGEKVATDIVRLKLDYSGQVFILKLHTDNGVINQMILKK
jgi:uncharacterized protein YjdB